jgi:hypothetical protein
MEWQRDENGQLVGHSRINEDITLRFRIIHDEAAALESTGFILDWAWARSRLNVRDDPKRVQS